MVTVKKLFALTLWLLIFPSLASAYTLSVAWEDNEPGKLKAIFSINEAVNFNILDAEIGWDSAVLLPNAAFFQPGALLTNFTVDPDFTTLTPASPLTFYAFGYPTDESTGPGELFSMLFDINPALSSPVTTSISVLSGALDAGLVLTYLDPAFQETQYTIDNYDPQNPLSFSHEVQPVASAPTPGALAMLVMGLLGLVRQHKKI
jgi:hypothetical protein